MTPFADLIGLVEAEAIEPWDRYIGREVLDDILPAVRTESTHDGRLYNWPFLLDVIVQGWNAELVERAGLDPHVAPKTWSEFIARAAEVVRTGAAPYGCTFDPRGWRSLVPITYSISTDVYTEDDLFDFEHEATLEALEVMKRLIELANPDVLDTRTTAGAGTTPDEGAFSSQVAAYYVKYQNAHVRFAATWPDPSRLALAPLPKDPGGGGSTVYWSTGLALLRYGTNKRAASAYAKTLTYSEAVWRDSLGGTRAAAGQLPVYESLARAWRQERPDWVGPWVFGVLEALETATPIRPHRLAANQFNIAQPFWERYLTGEETNARHALRDAAAAVRAAAD